MKKEIVHIIVVVCLIIYPVLFFMSCSNHDEYVPEAESGEGQFTATLALRLSTVGRTRSAGDSRELVHSLRVVVLHGDGTVEHNFLCGVEWRCGRIYQDVYCYAG